MLDQATIDRIHDAAHIEDVVSDYVTLRKRGVNLIGLCPFHDEKTPSFTVSPAKGIFKCFGCGKGGNSVHFIMEHEQIGYYDALKFLAKKYHIDFVERELSEEEKNIRNDRESMLLANEYAKEYFSNNLHNHLDGKSIALAYFKERGFREDIIKKFQLGYSLDQRDAFSKAALNSGLKLDYLIKTGLSLEHDNGQFSDRFRGRVMFPVHSLSGKIVAFGGRTLKKEDKMAKYVNSPESEIYHKSKELYGIYFAKKAIVKQDRCFLVEGYTDVISMHQNGIENVVASSGTSLTPGQIRMIHRFTENITVIFDGDPAGIKASLRGIDLLLEEGLNIKVLLLPDGDDPDSFARKHNAADFIAYVEENSADFIRFKTNLLLDDAGNDPVKKAGLILDIIRSIAIIPNSIIRAEYVKECSHILQVDEAMLYHEINKLKTAQRNQPTPSVRRDAVSKNDTHTQAFDQDNLKGKFTLEERNILQTLIRYGKHTLTFPNEPETPENPMLVADFIYEELNRDGISFNTPIHQQILQEYETHYHKEDFIAEKYFLYHQDPEIARLTSDLITEKYTLSKIHAKIKQQESDSARLFELVPRIIYEFKNSLILDVYKEKLLGLKHAQEVKDEKGINEIMLALKNLDDIKKQLAKTLGERVFTKF